MHEPLNHSGQATLAPLASKEVRDAGALGKRCWNAGRVVHERVAADAIEPLSLNPEPRSIVPCGTIAGAFYMDHCSLEQH